MSAAWTTVIALAVITFDIKAAGPVVLGGRRLPPTLLRVIAFFAPALLAALVIWETFGGEGKSLTIDARAVGLAAATAIHIATDSLIGTLIGAAAATALVRLIA